MIGGRSFLTAIRNGCGSFAMKRNLQMSTFPHSSTRSLSSGNNTLDAFGSFHQQKFTKPVIGNMELLSKRFAHYGAGSTTARGEAGASSWKLVSNLVIAAVGAIFYGASKAIFNSSDDYTGSNNSLMLQAACAEKDDCTDKCGDSPCLRKLDCQEELIIKANSDLERALKDVKSKAMEYTEAAMKAYCSAIALMQEYLDQGYCLIDSDKLEPPQYEEAWCCLYKIAKERCEKVQDAMQKGQCAWELLCRLREVIENGKECKYTSCNPLLVTAEESFICAERELLNLKARMDCVKSDSELVEQYEKVIRDFRKELKKDVDASVAAGQCQIQYPEQETAMMIIQAYRKAVRVHREVAQAMVCSGDIPERLEETQC